MACISCDEHRYGEYCADGCGCNCHERAEVLPKGKEAVDHPAHYGGKDNPYETIKVIEAWGLGKDAYLFQVVKYVSRAGKKGPALRDLKKARWYLDRRIKGMENQSKKRRS